MNPVHQFGIQLIQALQTLSPALDSLMEAFSFLGTIEFYLLLIPFLYWVVDAQLGFRILLMLLCADFLTTSFKQLFHQPRPYWIGNVKALAEETSYGLPSGHSSDSLAVWGTLASRLKKSWLWVLSTLLVLFIGLSRMYLGVHFPTDVLGGWLVGLGVAVILMRVEPWALTWLKRLALAQQIMVGFGFSLAMVLFGLLVGVLIAASPDPAEWARFSTQARSPTGYFTLAGALFGAVAGYVLMLNNARFETTGPVWQRAARYLVGIAGVLVIYLALDVLFAQVAGDETLPGYLLRYLRYATVTFWATYGAPWILLRLRLARPAGHRPEALPVANPTAAG